MSENSDVAVTSKLVLDRDGFVTDLQTVKSEYQQFAQQMAQQDLRITVIGQDLITKQVEEIIKDLSTREIVIPVRFQQVGDLPGAGGVIASGSSPVIGSGGAVTAGALRDSYAQFLARTSGGTMPEAYEVNEFTGGGAFPLVPLAAAGGAAGIGAARSMSALETELAEAEASRYVPSYDDIAEADAMMTAKPPPLPTALSPGRGGGRGLRLFMAAHLAERGVEAAYHSYEFNRSFDYDEQGTDPDQNTKQAIRQFNEMRGGFGGLTGAGRDFFHHILSDQSAAGTAMSWMTGVTAIPRIAGLFGYKASDFDDQGAIKTLDKSMEDDKKQREQNVIASRASELANRGERALGDAQSDLVIAESPEGLRKTFAEIEKRGHVMAESFDKMAKTLEEEAAKLGGNNPQRQKLLDRAAALRSGGATLGDEFTHASENAARHEDFIRRESAKESAEARITTMTGANDAMERRLRGDTLGASVSEINAQETAANKQAHARYIASDGKITDADYEGELIQIKRDADLRRMSAQKQEDVRNRKIDDEIGQAGIISPYARSRQRILDQESEDELADPAHADRSRRLRDARLGELDQSHERNLTEMRDRTDEMNLRAQHRDQEADNLALANREKEELAANEGDKGAQDAIRQKYQAERALQGMPHYSETSMRSIYTGVLKASLLSGYNPQAAIAANPGQAKAGGVPLPRGTNPMDPWGGGATPIPLDANGNPMDFNAGSHGQARNRPRDFLHPDDSLKPTPLPMVDGHPVDFNAGSHGQDRNRVHPADSANSGDAWKKWEQVADKILNGPQILTAA